MLNENHEDMEKNHSQEEQEMLFRTHEHLKQMEKELQKNWGLLLLK